MEGSAPDSAGVASAWLRCYRCWSQNLKVELHYEGVLRVDPQTGEAYDPDDELQEAVIQCRDCLHDQPHLSLAVYEEDGRRISRVEAVEDRWERMVVGTPWVASCTVTVDGDGVDCQGPDAADALAYAAFGDHGTREFFTHVRFHKHDGDDDRRPHDRRAVRPLPGGGHRRARGRSARRAGDHVTGRGVPPARRHRRQRALVVNVR